MKQIKSRNLFELAEEIAVGVDSLYTNISICREYLMDFMEANEWFGVRYEIKGDTPMINNSDCVKLINPMKLWLSAYRKPGKVKIELMLKYFDGIYPETCRCYRDFVRRKEIENEDYAWKLLDYLLSEMDKEITEYSESELDILIKQMYTEATAIVTNTFSEFLQTITRNGRPLTKWSYSFESHERFDVPNGAYQMDDFAILAYYVFNEQMWIKNELIKKAINSEINAELWVFVALHFICALRTTDIRRLPAPVLPYDKSTVFSMISSKTFSKQEAEALSEELCIRIKLKPMKPAKTAAYSNVPNLKLFVSESLKEPFGIILAIMLAHHSESATTNVLFSSSKRFFWRLSQLRSFFGDDFVERLDRRRFSSIRTNRAYLQGLDSVVSIDNEQGKAKGYMIASLARSHKSGIGSLAKTTEIYLKDARFNGYNPEFVIREMFERGIFSFIPAILLEMYTGEKYIKLPVTAQTRLIREIGIRPYQIEGIISAVDRALEKSKHVVNSIFSDVLSIHDNVFNILQNIASGNAPGRCDECLCLRVAAGLPCTHSDRNTCIGCGYEIYTKAAMHILMNEYARLVGIKESTGNKTEVLRCTAILEKAILPAVGEMLSAAKIFYMEPDIHDLLDIVERGLEDVSGGI